MVAGENDEVAREWLFSAKNRTGNELIDQFCDVFFFPQIPQGRTMCSKHHNSSPPCHHQAVVIQRAAGLRAIIIHENHQEALQGL